MALFPLSVCCPQCGSPKVFYSCQPNCCFNHVCSECRTTFELFTTLTGEEAGLAESAPSDLDCTSPTAPCARCGEPKVFELAGAGAATPRLVCAACSAFLTLGFSDVQPA